MNWRPAIEGMGSVGVAEPVRRDGKVDAGACGCFPDHAQDSQRLEPGAVLLFARAEHRFLRESIGAAEGGEVVSKPKLVSGWSE
jgi:hypothetical protein